jgi:hypothetical protein
MIRSEKSRILAYMYMCNILMRKYLCNIVFNLSNALLSLLLHQKDVVQVTGVTPAAVTDVNGQRDTFSMKQCLLQC